MELLLIILIPILAFGMMFGMIFVPDMLDRRQERLALPTKRIDPARVAQLEHEQLDVIPFDPLDPNFKVDHCQRCRATSREWKAIGRPIKDYIQRRQFRCQHPHAKVLVNARQRSETVVVCRSCGVSVHEGWCNCVWCQVRRDVG